MRRWEKVPHDPHCSESCRLVQGSQCFVRKIIPEQPAQRVQNPCKQRRLQPLPCRALLEARERVCTARQREWYRRELDDHKVFVSWFNRGQRPFLLKESSPGTCKKWKKVRKTGETHHAVEWFSDFCGGPLRAGRGHPFWLSRRRSAEPLR